eukprot:TRINITY_DN7453_c0_g1_i1.p1 TRINITY_DN7453_c0_g1~~TRINITY_DN7453_c0_g1_i1.p1  ORF type:complete len:126 (+),score=15.27 TRINITY_DN7453_c0_g1_i1:37-378(+)
MDGPTEHTTGPRKMKITGTDLSEISGSSFDIDFNSFMSDEHDGYYHSATRVDSSRRAPDLMNDPLRYDTDEDRYDTDEEVGTRNSFSMKVRRSYASRDGPPVSSRGIQTLQEI